MSWHNPDRYNFVCLFVHSIFHMNLHNSMDTLVFHFLYVIILEQISRKRHLMRIQIEENFHLPTTFNSTNIDWVGWMLSWHSYKPLSSSRTDFIRSDQWPMCLACSTRNRSSLLYVDKPTVSNWKSRRRIHDTCEWE